MQCWVSVAPTACIFMLLYELFLPPRSCILKITCSEITSTESGGGTLSLSGHEGKISQRTWLHQHMINCRDTLPPFQVWMLFTYTSCPCQSVGGYLFVRNQYWYFLFCLLASSAQSVSRQLFVCPESIFLLHPHLLSKAAAIAGKRPYVTQSYSMNRWVTIGKGHVRVFVCVFVSYMCSHVCVRQGLL